LESFEEMVLKTVDDTISELGPSARAALIYHLEKKGLRLNEVPNDPKKFETVLKDMFGPASEIIFSLILKRIAERIGVNPPTERSFTARLERLRREYEAKFVNK